MKYESETRWPWPQQIDQSFRLPAHATLRLLFRLLASLLTAHQLVLLLVPPPHLGISQVLLVLPLPGAVQAQASVGFDDAAKGHAGHLEEAGSRISCVLEMTRPVSF